MPKLSPWPAAYRTSISRMMLVLITLGLVPPLLDCPQLCASGSLGNVPSACLQEKGKSEQDVTERLGELNKAIRSNRSDPNLLIQRAQIYKQLSDYGRLWADVEKAVRLGPDSSSNLSSAAMVIVDLNPERAIELVDRSIQLDPKNIDAIPIRAMANALMEDFEASLGDLKVFLAAYPEHPLANAMAGNALMNQGKLNEAIAYFDRSIETEPLYQAVFDRAFCHRELGNLEQSIADYNRALEIEQNSAEVLCERGQVHQMRGSFASALSDFSTCVNSYPENAEAALQMAWLLATCPDEAIRNEEMAVKLAESYCDAHSCERAEPLHVLAAAYAEKGETAKALELMKRANSLSHFAPSLLKDGQRRLESITKAGKIREAHIPLKFLERQTQSIPRSVSLNEALQAPADVLGRSYLRLRTLKLLAQAASAGIQVHGELDGAPLDIGPENAKLIEKKIDERISICKLAIKQRGYPSLAPGYTVDLRGQCDEWGFSNLPFLIEQNEFDLYLSQGTTRHMGVAIESEVILRHDLETSQFFRGIVSGKEIQFVTPKAPGLWYSASEKCSATLTPSKIEGETWARAYQNRAQALNAYEEFALALRDLDKAASLSPTGEFLLHKAIFLATTSVDELRDPAEAGRLLEQVRTLNDLEGPETKSVMEFVEAAILSGQGDFKNAIKRLQRAIDMAPSDLVPYLKSELVKLKAGKAIHEDE